MESAHKLSSLSTTTTDTSGGARGCAGSYKNSTSSTTIMVPDQFPVGLRVLVVDDDTTCLRILEQMLRKCLYYVTTCCQATVALNLLRERKGCFDVVISDVHMPDMDGFKLLEHVGLEMDLPVIMMSADGRTSAVMKGIKHGACGYLIKPVRLEELKNIWQHVIRKKWNGNRDVEQSGSMDEHDQHKRGGDDLEYSSSANEGTDVSWKAHKKRKDAKEEEDEGDNDNDDPSSSKKPRVVWSVELHQQFVNAVNQLGIDKAVPKRILELMNVPGITRENVASHLQKFRLYLKRLSGVAQQQSGISNMYYGSGGESNPTLGSLGGLDIQALAASGQIPPQTLAALHAEVFGRPTSSIVLPVERGIAFGHPIAKCQPLVSKHTPQSSARVDDISSGYSSWLPNHSTVSSLGNQGSLNIKNNNMLGQILPQKQSVVAESPIHTISVQPSCLVVPSQSASSFHAGNVSIPSNQGSAGISSISSNYLSSPSQRVSVGTGHHVLGGADYNKTNNDVGILDGYSISSSMPSCSGRSDSVSSWQVQQNSPTSASTNLWGVQSALYNTPSKRGDLAPNQARNHLGFVGKGTSLPSRFAIDDYESELSNNGNNNINEGVKQELNLDFMDNAKSWLGSDATIFS